MTHDELLARMNLYTVCDKPTKPGMVCDNEHLRESYPEWFALRAVVELHKPVQDKPDQYTGESKPYCAGCWDAEDEYYAVRYFYPCPTIEAAEKELK